MPQLLQYLIDFSIFYDGRLNPDETPLEEAGDCGANTLFLLGVIGKEEAIALSTKQNKCWRIKSGKEFKSEYLLSTYLFTDPSKEYEIMECTIEELLRKVEELTEGYGTFLFMKNAETNLGHFTCIYKSIDGMIEIADLQTEENIKNDPFEPDRLYDYLNQYDLFYMPTMVDTPRARVESPLGDSHGSPARRPAANAESLNRAYETPIKRGPPSVETPVRRSPSRPESEGSEESPLKDSHGSPAKQFMRPRESPLSLEKKRSRVGGKRNKKRKTRKHRRKN
jgi:hypothetical protein